MGGREHFVLEALFCLAVKSLQHKMRLGDKNLIKVVAI